MQVVFYIFCGSLAVTLLATPLVARMALRLGMVDHPGARKIHANPIPRLGGLAIVLGVLAAIGVAVLLHLIPAANVRDFIAITLAALAIFAVGLADDIFGLPSIFKLFVLLAGASVVCSRGVDIDSISIGGFTANLGLFCWPVTVLWIVGITVAMNFIDGLDGLATGITAITAAAFALLAISSGNVLAAIVSIAILGSASGFLVFNFHPARIFMGDSGSMFLGFVLAVCSLLLPSTARPGALLLPAMALSVPLVDLLFTMIRRRVLQRRSIFAAERGHIHHRLLDSGLSQRQSALLLYAVTISTASAGFLALAGRYLALFAIISATFFVILFFHRCGAARFGEIYSALHRNRSMRRDSKSHRRCFEDLQLRLAMARTFDPWWSEVCAAAEALGFATLTLRSTDRHGKPRVSRWNAPAQPSDNGFTTSFPIAQCQDEPRQDEPRQDEPRQDEPPAQLTLTASTTGVTLESIGNRIALFSRLMDEFSLAGLAPTDAVEIRPRFEHEVDLPTPPKDEADAAYVGA